MDRSQPRLRTVASSDTFNTKMWKKSRISWRLERRLETVTTSSHEEKPQKKQKDADRIHISFKSKDSKRFFFTVTKKDTTSKDTHEAEACDKKQKGSRP